MADLKETSRKLIGSECLCTVGTLKGIAVTSWLRTVPRNRLVGSMRAYKSQPSV
jgi:hypothetical protein